MLGSTHNRCFVFGCSFTGHITGTWADYLGANFNEYYNFARGGACNTYILNKFIEADAQYNFNSKDDYVIVMFTSFSRFSYYSKNGWVCSGSVFNNPAQFKEFVNNMWTEDQGIYNSWIAINTIKRILTLKGIKHKFLLGVDAINNNGTFDDTLYNPLSTKMEKEFESLLDEPESMMTWQHKRKNYKFPEDYYYYEDEGYADAHPTQLMHYTYMKEKFPEFDTIESKLRYKYSESIYVTGNWKEQGTSFNINFNSKYNRAYNSINF
jgi:hypothetical protein